MVDSIGSKVNPAFINATNNLKSAIAELKSCKSKMIKDKNNPQSNAEYQNAEARYHQAESIWCNLPGLVQDTSSGALTKEQALKEVNRYMSDMKSSLSTMA